MMIIGWEYKSTSNGGDRATTVHAGMVILCSASVVRYGVTVISK